MVKRLSTPEIHFFVILTLNLIFIHYINKVLHTYTICFGLPVLQEIIQFMNVLFCLYEINPQ